jgi:hypothetical protein
LREWLHVLWLHVLWMCEHVIWNLFVKILEVSPFWCHVCLHSCWGGWAGCFDPLWWKSDTGVNENSITMSVVGWIFNEIWDNRWLCLLWCWLWNWTWNWDEKLWHGLLWKIIWSSHTCSLFVKILEVSPFWCHVCLLSSWGSWARCFDPFWRKSDIGVNENSVTMSVESWVFNEGWNLWFSGVKVLKISPFWSHVCLHSSWGGWAGCFDPFWRKSKTSINEDSVTMSMISWVFNEFWYLDSICYWCNLCNWSYRLEISNIELRLLNHHNIVSDWLSHHVTNTHLVLSNVLWCHHWVVKHHCEFVGVGFLFIIIIEISCL